MIFSLRAPRAAMCTVIASLLALTATALAPAASGQPSPAPSPSGSGSGELEVELLNPSAAYDATPKVSDRFDGTDAAYTIAARTTDPPGSENVLVEAYVALETSSGYGNDLTIGPLERAAPGSNVWQLDWDIPSSLAEGGALITVRAYVATAHGFVEADNDSVAVDLVFKDQSAAPVGAYETAELRYPEQDAPLGWYRPRVGAYRVLISGTTSPGATHVQLLVSTSPQGEPLTFTPCGSVAAVARGASKTFAGKCTLGATVFPSQVRAVAALAEIRQEATGLRIAQAADVRAVEPYLVEPEEMSIRISPPLKRAPAPATVCQEFAAIVTDDRGNLVLGANVDVHVEGPTDSLILIADELSPPEGHSIEQTDVCPGGPPVPSTPRPQGEHNVPFQHDAKHMESRLGSGLDYSLQPPGTVLLRIASPAAGFTELTAWVDDEEIRRETEQRPVDNDRLDPGEPLARARMQWLGAPLSLSLDPVGGTAAAGSCFPYTVKARSGTVAVPGTNVDLHAVGPDDELDFCDPAGAPARRAPSTGSGATAHQGEDPGESHHFNSAAPDEQHTEGTTDQAGNFVVGLTSPAVGDSTITAWIDGEESSEDDVLAFGEPTATGTISWVRSAAEAELGFVNPSHYGPATSGAGNGTQLPDRGGSVPILVRADMAGEIPGVEILLSKDFRATYTTLGEAERVHGTDLFRLAWPIDLPDGQYGLRARIKGTTIVEDVDVKVGAGDLLPGVPAPAYETLRLDEPVVASGAPFSRRSTVVSGRASAGAEGVDLFYTKVPAKDTPAAADWVFCGYADLDGLGTEAQPFGAHCTLTGSDQAAQVTGIAAITYDCTVDGCDASPAPPPPSAGAPPPPREHGQKDTGLALRVFGYDATPLLGIEPAETEAVAGSCRRLELVLRDQSGQPIGDDNVDVHLTGVGHFCRPADAAPGLRAPDGGGHATSGDPEAQLEAHHPGDSGPLHTEAETLPDGTVVFGVVAEAPGDVGLTAWVDRNDDDLQDLGEPADTALVHWVAAGGCTIPGTPGDDVLTGTDEDDVFCGLGGADTITGLGGNDHVRGGPGADRLFGGTGRDVLKGDGGRDLLNGGGGRDTCRGGPAPDRLLRCEIRSREPRATTRRSGR